MPTRTYYYYYHTCDVVVVVSTRNPARYVDATFVLGYHATERIHDGRKPDKKKTFQKKHFNNTIRQRRSRCTWTSPRGARGDAATHPVRVGSYDVYRVSGIYLQGRYRRTRPCEFDTKSRRAVLRRTRSAGGNRINTSPRDAFITCGLYTCNANSDPGRRLIYMSKKLLIRRRPRRLLRFYAFGPVVGAKTQQTLYCIVIIYLFTGGRALYNSFTAEHNI